MNDLRKCDILKNGNILFIIKQKFSKTRHILFLRQQLYIIFAFFHTNCFHCRINGLGSLRKTSRRASLPMSQAPRVGHWTRTQITTSMFTAIIN